MSTPRVVYDPIRTAHLPGNGAAVETRIDDSVGCRNLEQRILRVAPGGDAQVRNPGSEDVLFVLAGAGTLAFGDHVAPLEPRSGLVVPADTPYRLEAGTEGLELLSVLAPQPGKPGTVPATEAATPDAQPIREDDQEVIAAGDDHTIDYMDRWFRVLADPARGARYVTQFVGYIAHSRAPEHTHTYEEVIYITDGEGVLHIGESQPLRPGTSVYLPPGTPHCLENPHDDQVLALVGVFCPAGSPKERQPAN